MLGGGEDAVDRGCPSHEQRRSQLAQAEPPGVRRRIERDLLRYPAALLDNRRPPHARHRARDSRRWRALGSTGAAQRRRAVDRRGRAWGAAGLGGWLRSKPSFRTGVLYDERWLAALPRLGQYGQRLGRRDRPKVQRQAEYKRGLSTGKRQMRAQRGAVQTEAILACFSGD